MAQSVAIVSGASSGIGMETALLLTKNGYRVYAFNRNKTELPGVEFVRVDITNTEDIRRGVAHVLAKEGTIDLLVNNAGMGIAGALEHTTDADAEYLFDVNVFGSYKLAREVLPVMRENGGGRIINVSSLAAVFCLPFQGFYSASKAAVNSLFGAMQAEVKPFGIRITTVMPGDIKTGFTANRKKTDIPDSVYADRMRKSLTVMENDEQNGMPPSRVAQTILKQAQAKRPKALVTVGLKYKVLVALVKLLPASAVSSIVYTIYGGN